jgi:hypothetical protein
MEQRVPLNTRVDDVPDGFKLRATQTVNNGNDNADPKARVVTASEQCHLP